MNITPQNGWEQWIKECNFADTNLLKFLADSRYATKDLATYNQYLKNQSHLLDIATLKTKALTLAKNVALNIGFAAAFAVAAKVIQSFAGSVDDFIHSTERCKERVADLMTTFKSELDTANSNAKTMEALSSEYTSLSQGVNNLGENVSLTTDEYKRYNEIVNQIAEMFPDMVTGYTNEGNAILSLKGNVEQQRDPYKDAIIAKFIIKKYPTKPISK